MQKNWLKKIKMPPPQKKNSYVTIMDGLQISSERNTLKTKSIIQHFVPWTKKCTAFFSIAALKSTGRH